MGLILVANPGSASRKYALYNDELTELACLHYETDNHAVVCTMQVGESSEKVSTDITDIAQAAHSVGTVLHDKELLKDEKIEQIGVRIVAPGTFFTKDHRITDEVISALEAVHPLAPLHISATLHEIKILREAYPTVPIIGVSDSAFHIKKPNYAWNYGINIQDADEFEVKRYGYHGISIAASIATLWNAGKLPPKVVVCHLGSGSSVTAVFHGRSIDTTMGFSPNEGVIMATRSGNFSVDAARVLKSRLGLDDDGLDHYLNSESGIKGIGGSDDIRELIKNEADGDHLAHLALTTLIHTIHKAIGSMIVAMNGCDVIVFTGTVGERSAILRKRIVAHLEFMDFILDGDLNDATISPEKLTFISQKAKSRPIAVIPTNEAREIAQSVIKITNSNDF